MSNPITDAIAAKLTSIEQEHAVKVLYAVESGSRAWGFESADSDYDVRFIYVHEKNWYLNILPKRDVIEYPITDVFDYSGWDLRKALFLLNKSNPVLFEWLNSPIIYYKDEYFYATLEKLSQDYFSPISSVYHYLHMANRNFRQYLQGEQVKMNNRRASPAVSLTFMLYFGKGTAQVVSLHVFFDSLLDFAPGS
jgi:predicted nucleotidyltransferase